MLLESALLGLIEGLTEFLPISSTAHLLLVSWALKKEGSYSLEIMVQGGAILAVLVAYRERIAGLIHTPYAGSFLRNLAIAFIPMGLLGVLLYPVIIGYLFNLSILCVALILGGVAMLLVERIKVSAPITSIEAIPWTIALKIGLVQCLALIPGTSRAAATIVGALGCGVDRQTAVEFSFFLAIPAVLGAVAYHGYKLGGQILWSPSMAVGFGVAFVTALIAIHALLITINRYGITFFAWYRIILGCGLLIFQSLNENSL